MKNLVKAIRDRRDALRRGDDQPDMRDAVDIFLIGDGLLKAAVVRGKIDLATKCLSLMERAEDLMSAEARSAVRAIKAAIGDHDAGHPVAKAATRPLRPGQGEHPGLHESMAKALATPLDLARKGAPAADVDLGMADYTARSLHDDVGSTNPDGPEPALSDVERSRAAARERGGDRGFAEALAAVKVERARVAGADADATRSRRGPREFLEGDAVPRAEHGHEHGHNREFLRKKWWAVWDSNPRPPA